MMLLLCCGTVLDSILILRYPQRAVELLLNTHKLSWNNFFLVGHLKMLLLSRVSVENEILSIRDCTASDLSGCIREMQSGRFSPALYLFALLLNRLRAVKNFTWFKFVSGKLSGKYLLFNCRNDLTDIICGVINMNVCHKFYKFTPRWFMLPTLWKVQTNKQTNRQTNKQTNRQHKQTTAENLSPLTMPSFSLFISLFISRWVWTAAPVWRQENAAWSSACGSRLLAVLSLTAVLVVHKLLSCLAHCATPSGAQTSCGDALVAILFTSEQSSGPITAGNNHHVVFEWMTWEQFCIPRPDLSFLLDINVRAEYTE